MWFIGGFQFFGGRSGGDGCSYRNPLPFYISIIGPCTGTTPPPPSSLKNVGLCLVNVDIFLLLPILNGDVDS